MGILAVVLFIVCTGCPDMFPEDETGSLVLTVNSVDSRLYNSDLDMVISEYRITLTHQGTGNTISETFSISQTIVVNDLPIGEWEVVVAAVNEIGEIVAEGSVSVTIIFSEASQADVNLAYLEGDGIFVLEVSWGNGVLHNPKVTASLQEAAAGSEGEILAWDIELLDEDEDGRYEGASARKTITAGNYLLRVTITDEDLGFTTGRGPDNVTIRASETAVTEAVYTVEVPTGSISITITDPVPDTFSLTVSAGALTVPTNESITFTADPGETIVAQYVWSANGEIVEGESSAELVQLFDKPGNYTVTCLAEDENGFLASSAVDVMVGEIFPSGEQ